MNREPVLTAVTVLIAATIGLLVAFGVEVTEDQKAAIVAFVVATYVMAGIVRQKVTPV